MAACVEHVWNTPKSSHQGELDTGLEQRTRLINEELWRIYEWGLALVSLGIDPDVMMEPDFNPADYGIAQRARPIPKNCVGADSAAPKGTADVCFTRNIADMLSARWLGLSALRQFQTHALQHRRRLRHPECSIARHSRSLEIDEWPFEEPPSSCGEVCESGTVSTREFALSSLMTKPSSMKRTHQ